MLAPWKYVLLIISFVAVFCCLSWMAVYAFWFGVWLFDSVPAARACDAIGKVFLLPAWCFLWLAGGFNNPQAPLFDPVQYAMTNGALAGTVAYACCRRIFFRGEFQQDRAE